MSGTPTVDLMTLTTTTQNMTAPDSVTTTLTDTTTSDLDIQVLPEQELYPWAENDKERRRCFIYEYYPHDASVDIKFELEAMSKIEKWLLGR